MKKLDSVIAVALAVTAAGTQLSDAADNDKAATAVSSYCDEDFYLSKLAAHLDEKLVPLQTMAQRLASEMRWHTVARAAAPDAKTRCLLHGLTAIISKTLAEARTELATITPTIKLAAKQINKQRQIARRAHAIAGLTLSLDATGGAERPGNSGQIITVDLKAASGGTKLCKLEAPADGKLSGHDAIPSALHTLRTTDEAKHQNALQHDKLHVTSSGSCTYSGEKTTFEAAAVNCQLKTGAPRYRFRQQRGPTVTSAPTYGCTRTTTQQTTV
ncbi:uncharacterized protein TEOVI_000049800 [Trypanosoma equiperdum]|uniref:Trypanosome variant surface glycoprotein (A-type) n=1 Tax=Trypanosoma equiperdum TaxID=5694 RepID=A0A1G4I8W1_TRYEQ|nr:hypothetical protein, conserved [Trypanosoma equiperdum]